MIIIINKNNRVIFYIYLFISAIITSLDLSRFIS